MPKSRNRHKSPTPSERARRNRHSALASRVSHRELRRQADRAIVYGRQAYATLLAVLAQKGGDVVVTQGTLDQVTANYDHLGFVVENIGTGEFRVKLTEGRAVETPAATPATGMESAECRDIPPTHMDMTGATPPATPTAGAATGTEATGWSDPASAA